MKRFAILLIVYSIIATIFYFWPKLDLKVSALFFTPTLGANGFTFAHTTFSTIFGYISKVIAAVTCIGAAIIGLRRLFTYKSLNPRYYLDIAYICLVFLIGATLIIQWGFKDYYHRPRPYQVQEFGGQLAYTSPFAGAHGQCDTNCSFPSGHAAVGFFFIAFAFLPQLKRWNQHIELGGWVLGLSFGMLRVMSGHHFLSDVLFSGFIMYSTILVLQPLLRFKILTSPRS